MTTNRRADGDAATLMMKTMATTGRDAGAGVRKMMTMTGRMNRARPEGGATEMPVTRGNLSPARKQKKDFFRSNYARRAWGFCFFKSKSLFMLQLWQRSFFL